MQVVPAVCTPNGDGVNEESRIVFQVLRLVQEVDFSIGIYDLAGRRCVSFFLTPCLPEPTSKPGMAAMRPVIWCLRGAYVVHIAAETESGKRC